MNGVTQTILAGDGIIGNCMQAAVATLLELPLEQVPHFGKDWDWRDWFEGWCTDRGLIWVTLGVDKVRDGMPCLLVGQSPRGIPHVVVGNGLKITWDPHPSREGLVSIGQAWVLARPVGP